MINVFTFTPYGKQNRDHTPIWFCKNGKLIDFDLNIKTKLNSKKA